MNKKKIKDFLKKFIKGNTGLIGWMFLYSFIEIGIAVGLFTYYLKNSVEFQMKLLDVFSFINTEEYLTDAEFSIKMLEGMFQLTDILILPILGLSAIALMGLLAIKCKVKKEKVIKKISKEDVLKYMLIGSAMNLIITLMLAIIPDQLMESYSQQVGLTLSGSLWLSILVVGILGPISEEIVFRYFSFESCRPIGIKYAIVGSALMFGIAHGNLIQSTYAFVMGLIFAAIDYKENNLLPSIVMHITINLSSVLISNFWNQEIAGLTAYLCMILAVNILMNRKDENSWTNNIIKEFKLKSNVLVKG